jgi:hypothetical protein
LSTAADTLLQLSLVHKKVHSQIEIIYDGRGTPVLQTRAVSRNDLILLQVTARAAGTSHFRRAAIGREILQIQICQITNAIRHGPRQVVEVQRQVLQASHVANLRRHSACQLIVKEIDCFEEWLIQSQRRRNLAFCRFRNESQCQ